MRVMATINVTQDHIDHGCPFNSECCPIAQAVQDVLLPGFHVSMMKRAVMVTYPGHGPLRYPVPEEAEDFVRRFDNFEDVEPFTFELPIPSGLLK